MGAVAAAQAQVIAGLRDDNTQLRTALADLHTANARLQMANDELAARVAELEGRLAKDSSNSSKPPSSDGLSKRPVPSRAERPKSTRRPGKQPGSPGAHLERVAHPDQVVVHTPQRCQACGGMLADAPVVGVEARQVFDLPPIRLQVVEHQVQRRRCTCGQATGAVFPTQARAVACYGPGVRSLACYLQGRQHQPVERTAELLADVLGATVATGSLAAVMGEAAGRLGGFLEVVRQQLAAASVACFDETGARVAGRLHWVHSASTQQLTLYTVHPKRGTKAMDAAGVLPRFGGVAVHDGWASYLHYTDATHALCNAHHLRELDAVAAEPGQGWAGEMAEWLTIAAGQAAAARAAGACRLDPGVLGRLQARYQEIIVKGKAANPPPARPAGGRRPKRSPAANLLARLDARRDQVQRFLVDLRVPFTNNLSERDIRMVKLQQKISGCWRTTAGAQAFLAVRSYLSTARKHGENPLAVLRQLFVGQPWLPPATAAPLPP